MAMMPTFLAGGNLVVDTMGWLESGLVSSLEKFAIDIELLRMLEWTFRPLEVDGATLAFEAYEEVGPGGHFFGCQHTLDRFRTYFYEPLVSSRDNSAVGLVRAAPTRRPAPVTLRRWPSNGSSRPSRRQRAGGARLLLRGSSTRDHRQ